MEKNRHNPQPDEIQNLIKQKNTSTYTQFFKNYHEADIAEALSHLTIEEQHQFFLNANPELGADVLEEMTLLQQIELIKQLKTTLAAKYVEKMEPDDAADLIEELQDTDESKANDIIKALPQSEANDIQELLTYLPHSAGSIMTSQHISIPENLSIKNAITHIQDQNPPDSEISFYIYITNKKHQLIGYTTLRNLLMTPDTKTIKSIRNDYPIKAHINDDQEEVALLFQKYDVVALPVVNDNNQLVGLITVDDVVDIVVEEATEDLYKLSGTSEINEEKLLHGHIIHPILSRIPWLIITILGGIIASYLITYFSTQFNATLFPLAVSISFIPMLMGLAGNVGNQSATIVVRGIATGHFKTNNTLKYIMRELFIGLVIGLIIGGVVFIFAYFILHFQPLLISIVSLAILLNITTATLLGTFLPLLLRQLHIDPAIASAPFISTSLDIIGQIIYFMLTISIINYLN